MPEDERDGEVEEPELPVSVGAADGSGTLARFEDVAGEWRWRLRHRNGNVIATGGEGYTRKYNARKGLRSVVANAPGADVVDESLD
nr:YegP family protein [Halobacterium sp. R2-5]